MQMSQDEIILKITEIIAVITKNSSLILDFDVEFQNIRGWDSLNYVKFIVEIERYYKIRFKGADISAIKTIRDSCNLIESKISI